MLRTVTLHTVQQELEEDLSKIPSDHELNLLDIYFTKFHSQVPLSLLLKANLTLRAKKVKIKAIDGASFDMIQQVRPGECIAEPFEHYRLDFKGVMTNKIIVRVTDLRNSHTLLYNRQYIRD